MIHEQNTKTVMLIQPQAIKDNTEWVGSNGSTPVNLDTQGFNYLTVYFALGATDIAMTELSIYESDSSASGYTVIDATDSAANSVLPAADDDNKIYAFRIPLGGSRKRYFRIEAIPGDGTSGSYAVAWAVLSRADQAPNTAAERGLESEVYV